MEIWKDVVGYEGYYQVSNFGNIRSVDRVIYSDKLHIGVKRENMLCEKCPFPKNAERCTVEGCKDYLKECLLKDE